MPNQSDKPHSWSGGSTIIIAIALLAVTLRILGILLFGDTEVYGAFEFGRIAENIVAGNGYSFDFYGRYPLSPTAWMAPLYTYLLAAYYWLLGQNLFGMAILQAIVCGLVCWGLGIIGTAVSGITVGIIAATIFAVYPEAVFMPQKFVAEPLLLLWLVLFFICGVRYLSEGKRHYMIWAGIWAGLAALTKESALIFPLALILWIWLIKRVISRQLVFDFLLLILITGAIISPWTVRNYITFDKFIPIRTNFWFNVWRGNNPYATGTPRGYDKENIERSMDPSYLDGINSQLVGDEVDRERVYRRFALNYIKENPAVYAGLCLKRLFYYWTADPTHPLTGNPLYWIPWFILLGFAGVGFISVLHRWQDYSFWYLLFVITTLVYSLTLVLPRYRIPLLPGLMLLAAEGVQILARFRVKAQRV